MVDIGSIPFGERSCGEDHIGPFAQWGWEDVLDDQQRRGSDGLVDLLVDPTRAGSSDDEPGAGRGFSERFGMDDRSLEMAQDRFDTVAIRAFFGSNGEFDFARCGGLSLGTLGVQIVAAYDRNRPESQLGSRIDSLDVRGQQVSFLDRHERGQNDDETRGVVLDRRVDPLASFGQDRWPWIGKRQIRGSCRAGRRIGVRRWVLESRVLDASLVVDVFESKPTFVAHEVPLGLWVFPGA